MSEQLFKFEYEQALKTAVSHVNLKHTCGA